MEVPLPLVIPKSVTVADVEYALRLSDSPPDVPGEARDSPTCCCLANHATQTITVCRRADPALMVAAVATAVSESWEVRLRILARQGAKARRPPAPQSVACPN
jgi:hypothetical protein